MMSLVSLPHDHLHHPSTSRVPPLRQTLGKLLVGRDHTRYNADPPLKAKLALNLELYITVERPQIHTHRSPRELN
jgi:hypothetical protein